MAAASAPADDPELRGARDVLRLEDPNAPVSEQEAIQRLHHANPLVRTATVICTASPFAAQASGKGALHDALLGSLSDSDARVRAVAAKLYVDKYVPTSPGFAKVVDMLYNDPELEAWCGAYCALAECGPMADALRPSLQQRLRRAAPAEQARCVTSLASLRGDVLGVDPDEMARQMRQCPGFWDGRLATLMQGV